MKYNVANADYQLLQRVLLRLNDGHVRGRLLFRGKHILVIIIQQIQGCLPNNTNINNPKPGEVFSDIKIVFTSFGELAFLFNMSE